MAKKRLWFGTKERMTWIPCPAINAGLGNSRWLATGGFLNGGAYQRQSAIGRNNYSFSWNPQKAEDLYEFLGYFDGIHGSGPYFFIDPFAAQSNVLPSFLASPVTMAEDAPNFGGTQRVTPVLTGPSSFGYPAMSGQLTVGPGFGPYRSYSIPVPPEHNLHLGVHGSSSGTARVVVGGGVSNSPVRVNNVLNPAFTNLLGGAVTAGTGGTAALTQGTGRSGNSLRATWTVASTTAGLITLNGSGYRANVPGTSPVTASVYVRPSVTLSLRPVLVSNTLLTGGTGTTVNGGYVSCPAGVWTRLSVTSTSTNAFKELRVQSQVGVPLGTVIDADDMLIEASGSLGDYFDGASAFSRWSGASNASPSYLLATSVTTVPMMSVSDVQRTNTVLPGGAWYDITIQGDGVLTLAGLMGQILPVGQTPEPGNFIPGRGNTGVRLAGDPAVTGYSAALANASVGMTAEFVETGAWE